MTPLLFTAAVTTLLLGLLLILLGSQPQPVKHAHPRPHRRRRKLARATRVQLAAGAAAGLITAAVTGWWALTFILPIAFVGLPYVFRPPTDTGNIHRLDALEEWVRSLSGVLHGGHSLEQAITATVRSAAPPIRKEVKALADRLRARQTTPAALRAFADDIDDPTGDMIAASLILGSNRRGGGLTLVLDALAASVADDVKFRRQIEADRAKPRTNVKIITIATLAALVLAPVFLPAFVAPYATVPGQLILTLQLTAFGLIVLWMRRMSQSKPMERFLGNTITTGARR